MIAVKGYFDGTVCIPLEKIDIKPNQKVIITVLDEVIETGHSGTKKKLNDLFNCWQGIETAEELIKSIYQSRTINERKLGI